MSVIGREKALPLLAGILCVFLIAFAASTIATPVMYTGDGVTQDWERGDTPQDMDPGETNQSGLDSIGGTADDGPVDLYQCIEPLDSTPGTIAYFGAALGLLYLIYRRWGMGVAMLSAYGITPIVTMMYFLLTACIGGGDVGEGDPARQQQTVIDSVAGSTVATPESSPLILAGLIGVVFVGLVVLIYSSLGTGEDETMIAEDLDEDVDMEEFAAAAREAADRLEAANADVDNEVYRAWKEMTDLLHVDDPETSTPGEFATAAVAAGLARDHVGELTRLFEEVRYGHRDAEGEREERAIEIFRAIESAYGPEGSSDHSAEED